jgi:hypothetical protein
MSIVCGLFRQLLDGQEVLSQAFLIHPPSPPSG